ncbi:MAG: hypothetical protein OJF59_000476 [Cytophagales bacterium]|nr:MAG: hypothetical protein OJF59_000476 [Cytophagales bacterium]
MILTNIIKRILLIAIICLQIFLHLSAEEETTIIVVILS